MDFVTTAPAPLRATRSSDAPVVPRIPAASSVGFFSVNPVIVIMTDQYMMQYLMGVSMGDPYEFIYTMIYHAERS
jgi:hypothetical protein